MALCVFELNPAGGAVVCRACGKRLPVANPTWPPERYRARCGGVHEAPPDAKPKRFLGQGGSPNPKPTTGKKPGLGDRLEQALKSIGVTEDRYKDAKALFGLPPTCGCSKRKEWLNKVSEWWRNSHWLTTD